MSSFKNAAKAGQRIHKERSQPSHRANFGLLEKKKDYKLRAKDHHAKQKVIRKLKKKALERNPDEFYFHMINSQVDEDGEHHEKSKEVVTTQEQIKLMQSQDFRYISMKRTMETKKIEKMKSSLHLLSVDGKPTVRHTFFVDSPREVDQMDLAHRLDTDPELLERNYNRPRKEMLRNKVIKVHGDDVEDISKETHRSYEMLTKRIEREKKLVTISQKLEVKRHLANKKEAAPKRIAKETKTSAPVYRWKKERKR